MVKSLNFYGHAETGFRRSLDDWTATVKVIKETERKVVG